MQSRLAAARPPAMPRLNSQVPRNLISLVVFCGCPLEVPPGLVEAAEAESPADLAAADLDGVDESLFLGEDFDDADIE